MRALIAILLLFTALQAEPALSLMPAPAHVSLDQGKLTIDGSFGVRITGHTDRRLQDAVTRFTTRLSRQTGIPMASGARPVLTIDCRAASPDVPSLGQDESYQLEIAPSGARLSAPTVTGALRGLETFSQLIAPDADSFSIPALHIEDHPRFPWRGLSLDVSRHWMPLQVIERNIDAMAAVKMNVFHWHLSDDQGFRVESKVFPKLQQLGSDGKFYTQAEVRQIIAYAAERGLRVVPEFDIPGHTTSWLVGYPELASASGPFRIERKWGIFEPTLDPTRQEVYTFLDRFIGEMAALFPDAYFHIGGDEVLDAEWKQNPAIQDFCKKHGFKSSAQLHAYFNERVHALVTKHGKQMIGWDEVLQPGMPNDLVIQSWRGQQSLADAARKGYRGTLSFGYYLDHLNPASYHYQIDPLGGAAQQLNEREAARILGGEACMWTEYVTEETVDSRLWPRGAAIAERLWSPANVTGIESMYRRLATVSRWLEWSGVEHRSGYQRMLDRLAGGTPAPALRVLADVVEPLGIDQRQAARSYSHDIPLNRLVDAAQPESETVRLLEDAIRRFVADPGRHHQEGEEIRLAMSQWSVNDGRLRPLLASSILLEEAAPLSEDLSKVGSIGLRALQYLESGEPAPAKWLAEQKLALNQMEQPKAEVVLAAARPVKALLEALSGPSIKTDQSARSRAKH
jgi:hexosaminidase